MTFIESQRTKCPLGHPYEGTNLYINPRGERQCKTCNAIRSRKSTARKRFLKVRRAALYIMRRSLDEGDMKIQVILRGKYGREDVYPSCEKAKLFCALLKQKTLTRIDVEGIKALGYEVEVVPSVARL